jgi:hypothetical protein
MAVHKCKFFAYQAGLLQFKIRRAKLEGICEVIPIPKAGKKERRKESIY